MVAVTLLAAVVSATHEPSQSSQRGSMMENPRGTFDELNSATEALHKLTRSLGMGKLKDAMQGADDSHITNGRMEELKGLVRQKIEGQYNSFLEHLELQRNKIEEEIEEIVEEFRVHATTKISGVLASLNNTKVKAAFAHKISGHFITMENAIALKKKEIEVARDDIQRRIERCVFYFVRSY